MQWQEAGLNSWGYPPDTRARLGDMVQPGGNGARQLCHNTGALGLTVPNCCSHVVIIRVHFSGNICYGL